MTSPIPPARVLVLAAGLVFFFSGGGAAASAQTQARESDVARLIGQAEDYYKKTDYKLAVGCYLEAAALSQSRMNLSQSYFGLSLCYFQLRDNANALKYVRKVLEVDPNKEISELFYPVAFVRLFADTRAETSVKPPTAKSDAPNKAAPAKAEAEGQKKDKVAGEAAQPADRTPPPKPAAPAPRVIEDVLPPPDRGGHWEMSGHYSSWSLSAVQSLFEKTLTDEVSKEIQGQIIKKAGRVQAGLLASNFRHGLGFGSDGSNYGFEIRYFSRGRTGTFSLGLALEKNDFTLTMNGPLTQEFANGAVAAVEATSTLVTSPFSAHVNFRWEAGTDAILIPYFTLGFGLAPLQGTLSYDFSGTFRKDAVVENIADSQEKTLADMSSDTDFRFPDILVILQLSFGLKVQMYRGMYFLGEVAVWDGVIFRGGLAFRF